MTFRQRLAFAFAVIIAVIIIGWFIPLLWADDPFIPVPGWEHNTCTLHVDAAVPVLNVYQPNWVMQATLNFEFGLFDKQVAQRQRAASLHQQRLATLATQSWNTARVNREFASQAIQQQNTKQINIGGGL